MPRANPWSWPLTALAMLVPLAAVAEEAALHGTYAVVDHRIAFGVAATADALDPESRRQEVGRAVGYDDVLTWYDGRSCSDWQAPPVPRPIRWPTIRTSPTSSSASAPATPRKTRRLC